MLTKMDSRGVQTTFCQPANPSLCYNGLNQLLGKIYSSDPQNTPGVTYAYDGHGWLIGVSSSGVGYTYAHDQIGRVNGGTQSTGGQNYTFNVSLMPFVGIRSIAYPNSGRVVATGYDSAGRANCVTA